MIVIAGLILGTIWGGLLAKRRGGKAFDIAQYIVIYGMIFGLLGMVATVVIERML